MPTVHRHLFGPGPSNPYPEATTALSKPLLGHLDPEFLALMDATSAMLRRVYGTQNSRTLPLSGTGSAGMEAAFVNTVREGDAVVVAVNGLFGQRMCEVARRCGAEVVPVEHAWGTPVDIDRVVAAHPSPTIIAAVHAETSTGVLSDARALGEAVRAHHPDALLLLDTVTSLAGSEVLLDAWGVDVAYAGTQKCLGVPPGLAPFTMSDRAYERRVKDPRSWYLDMGLLSQYAGEAGGSAARAYHHTAPVGMVVSLHDALERIEAEGLQAVQDRHREAGRLLQDGLLDLGLELFVPAQHRLPQLTTVVVPEGVDAASVRRRLLETHHIEIGAGVGPHASSLWRIGLMGHNARPDAALLVLAALRDTLGR
ncbi:pyridoxal-phosphate-dependent aminotransferase family protein [Nocardioides campestrisoli]|uniref:pyridoxal-phosphate-dependent aminotransferase family protein n=1 Tax=Nocardioides campestrisoli TaxID=2736757 RepID=UPI00163D6142|nr:alanine--glyoxylate aminotransferase family protein [Nocardioides campestrisoli]